jgi:ketosteroid isomerase-like protein
MTNETAAMPASDADQSIADLTSSYEQHYNLGHATQTAALYTDSAVALMADGTVARGRSAIEAYLAGQIANGSPQLSVELVDTKSMGDTAMSIGSWHVTSTPAGADTVHVGGHWMAAYERTSDGWKAMALITNYDSEPTPEMLSGQTPSAPPVETSAMGSVADAFEAAWNGGDAADVAALYAEDAWVSYSNQPVSEGRAAIEAALQQQIRGTIEIHGVKSADLGDGWGADGGWYLVSGGGQPPYRGNYMLLAQTDSDGAPRIQWAVSNGRPAPGGG